MSDDNAQKANQKKLFVGNLPFSMNQDDLSQLFAEYGEVVDAKLVLDRETSRSRGFGFVEFADEDSANKAVDAMNGQEIDGRQIVVNVARPPRPRFADRGSRPGGGYRGNSRNNF